MSVEFSSYNSPAENRPQVEEIPQEGLPEGACAICHIHLSQRPEGVPQEEVLALAHTAGRAHHAFHDHCLRSWLQRNSNCPTCRAPATIALPWNERVAEKLKTGFWSLFTLSMILLCFNELITPIPGAVVLGLSLLCLLLVFVFSSQARADAKEVINGNIAVFKDVYASCCRRPLAPAEVPLIEV